MISLDRLKPTIGFTASLLGVWCQVLLLATISLAPLAAGRDATAGTPICHADDGTQPAKQPPGHPIHDCTLCVLCLSHVSSLGILPPTPLPERHFDVVARRDAPRPRAPPVRLVLVAQPRGPPALI
jgi:hypothetical protein